MPIELYSPRWHSHVVRLASEIFGEGYFVRASGIAVEPGSLIVVSHEKGALLGFAQGRLLPEGELRAYLEQRVTEIPPEIAEADAKGTLGVVQAIAVAPECRRRGTGTKLVRILHDRLVGIGADKLIITFKRGPSAPSVDRMMSKLAFQVWTSLPSYWRERCDSGEFKCTERQHKCTCEALLYRKAIY